MRQHALPQLPRPDLRITAPVDAVEWAWDRRVRRCLTVWFCTLLFGALAQAGNAQHLRGGVDPWKAVTTAAVAHSDHFTIPHSHASDDGPEFYLGVAWPVSLASLQNPCPASPAPGILPTTNLDRPPIRAPPLAFV